jgi:hypothetical protein
MMRVVIALVHYPVLDREGGVVTTAITNLDLHDMARSARTYGAGSFFVVHPVEAQRLLAERVREHWVEGSGKRRIPDRAGALELVRVVPLLEDVYAALGGRDAIEVWTTAASPRGPRLLSFEDARSRLGDASRTTLILFGTGWGLATDVMQGSDACLEPIRAGGRAGADTAYNHLSVRAACAITLDRLLGPQR